MANAFWFTYVLECSDKSLYIGITNNLATRVIKHNQGKGAKYLLGKRPVKLIYSEKHLNKSKARGREIQLKGWSRRKKLLLIEGKLFSE